MTKEIVFYYDVICPYAYLASKLIGDVAKRTGAKLLWRPVLLGGIYKSTKPPDVDIPDNKVINTYSQQKKVVLAQDLARLFSRNGVPIHRVAVPDIKTLNAMRLIASTPDETSDLRSNLTHSLYNAVWQQNKDVSRVEVLQAIADATGYQINVRALVNDKHHPARSKLIENTEEAVSRGAFGVPSMWANGRLFFGNDRLFMLERELGLNSQPHRLLSKPLNGERIKLTFYMDFTSPWSYMGFKQLKSLLASVSPKQVDIEYVPVLIGAIFKAIGTPIVPMQKMGGNKRRYYTNDFSDWLKYHQMEGFNFSSHFPLNSVTACRVAVAHPSHALIEAIFDATWSLDRNIGDIKVLKGVLASAGFNADHLLACAGFESNKLRLRENVARALQAGVCGLPSYQINDGEVVFGQDRTNVVADMLLGWESRLTPPSKL